MHSGTIVRWNDEKGFGFVRADGSGEEAFVHISSFSNRAFRPTVSSRVRYRLTQDAHGRPRADHVRFEDDSQARVRGRSLLPLVTSVTFLSGVAYLAVEQRVPRWVLVAYLVLSGIAFGLYASDKRAARSGGWRHSEKSLLLTGLLGGWPGALVAQNRLRHKSRKIGFQVPFWMTVLANCGALYWMLTPEGARSARRVTGMLDVWVQSLF